MLPHSLTVVETTERVTVSPRVGAAWFPYSGGAAMYHLSLTIITGVDGADRWAAHIVGADDHADRVFCPRPCCDQGHTDPEAAAWHGSYVVAQRLAEWARSLPATTAGGQLLDKLSKTA